MQRIRDQDQSRNRIPPGTVIESIFATFFAAVAACICKKTPTTCVIIGLSEGLDKLEMDILLAHSISGVKYW